MAANGMNHAVARLRATRLAASRQPGQRPGPEPRATKGLALAASRVARRRETAWFMPQSR